MLQRKEFPFIEVVPNRRQLGVLESSLDSSPAQVERRGLELFQANAPWASLTRLNTARFRRENETLSQENKYLSVKSTR